VGTILTRKKLPWPLMVESGVRSLWSSIVAPCFILVEFAAAFSWRLWSLMAVLSEVDEYNTTCSGQIYCCAGLGNGTRNGA
jgi:hypothetical protein